MLNFGVVKFVNIFAKKIKFMVDTLTPEQRHKCMAAVKSKNTNPEMIVRKYLFSQGFRYRLHNNKLIGKPDLTFKKYNAVIFIDGCFWHYHNGCKNFKLPKTKQDYWIEKLNRNRKRDIEVTSTLIEQGWRVFRIWECQIKNLSTRYNTLNDLIKNLKSY